MLILTQKYKSCMLSCKLPFLVHLIFKTKTANKNQIDWVIRGRNSHF